ncbi:hypothetical protein ACFFLZ_03865 [Photobacterium aphoticum]|uniref:hypothetical protein n=1 Tax=Photobacterium aphoticum TaxID=754436 RepID=UPI0011B25919|nr:hypothetical protein [Photobacterium aphoticum]
MSKVDISKQTRPVCMWKRKVMGIAVWTLLFLGFFLLFPEVGKTHPHLAYSALLSPFIVVTVLIENPTALLDGEFPSALYPGFIYWGIVVGIVCFLHPKSH